MSLRVKTVQGSMFMGIATLVSRPLTIVLSIILLRLLNPEDFGAVALAMILVNSANIFTDMGMRSAVIQSRDDIAKVVFYAFVIVNVASVAFYALVYIFAGPISSFLGGDETTIQILRVLGFIIVLDGLWIIPQAMLSRDLKFRRLMWVKITPEIAYGVMAVILALMGYGLWSLVWGTLFAEFLRIIFYWVSAKPRYWLRPQPWDAEIVRGLFKFGLPATASSMLRYVNDNWDDWLVGRTLGTTALGFYGKAYDTTSRLMQMFTSALFGNVMQPSYAKVQEEPDRLRRGYLKSTNMVMLIMAPIAFGLAVLANNIVLVLLGEKWLPMVTTWQVFSIYTLTRPISTNASPLFLAVGKPRLNLEAGIVLLIVTVPLILTLIGPYGIVGVAIAVTIAHLVAMFFNIYQVNKLLPGTAAKTFVGALPFVIAAAAMAVGVQLLKTPVISLTNGENLLSLILLVVLGAAIYFALIVLLQRAFVVEMLTLAGTALGLQSRLPRFFPEREGGKKSRPTPIDTALPTDADAPVESSEPVESAKSE